MSNTQSMGINDGREQSVTDAPVSPSPKAAPTPGGVTASGVPYTPGPWIIEKHWLGEGGGIAIDATDPLDGENFEVCEVWGIDSDRKHDERSRANALLIAAAPDLLEALRFLAESADDPEFWHDHGKERVREVARAAIAKAEGAKP